MADSSETPGPWRYALLAGAICGRRVVVRAAESARDALAYSDGRQTIVLPAAYCAPSAADAEDPRNAVAVQAALMTVGSLDAQPIRRLVGRPAAARRYAWFEFLRAARLIGDRLPFALAHHAAVLGAPSPGRNTQESLALAMDEAAPRVAIPDFVGTVRPWAVLVPGLPGGGGGASGDRQGVAPSARRQGGGDFPEEKTESSRLLRLFENPLIGRNALADMLDAILGARHAPDATEGEAGQGAGAEAPVGRVRRAWRRGVLAVRAAVAEALPDMPAAIPSGRRYPEWDDGLKRFRADWACVDEVDPWREGGPRDLPELGAGPSRELGRQLSRLGLDCEMRRRQPDGSELDVGRLLECAIDLRAGHAPAALDIYRASLRTRRDLGIVVLLDASGSGEERNATGTPLFDLHLGASYRLARTLHRLGDRVGFYAFQSWGRHMVRLVRLKGHEEGWSGRVVDRCGRLEAGGYTRTGAAIRHAHHVLTREMRLPNRLLILVSDGFPYDQDYEGRQAEADTRIALGQARAEGTACVCLCIGGSVDTRKLATVFGGSGLLAVERESEMVPRIRGICADALASVSRRSLAPRAAGQAAGRYQRPT